MRLHYTYSSPHFLCVDVCLRLLLFVHAEASQALETSTLIPLRHGVRHLVLVGDQKQLSATVVSARVSKLGLGLSLFDRMTNTVATTPVKNGAGGISGSGSGSVVVMMLDTQYRMHPTISRFPSATFYSSRLKDGANVTRPGYGLPFLSGDSSRGGSGGEQLLKPFLFFNLQSSQDDASSAVSRSNKEEAKFVVSLLLLLCSEKKKSDATQLLASSSSSSSSFSRGTVSPSPPPLPVQVGIITPYNEQLAELTRLISQHCTDQLVSGWSASVQVELNTVDGFQGREKDWSVLIVLTHFKSKSLYVVHMIIYVTLAVCACA